MKAELESEYEENIRAVHSVPVNDLLFYWHQIANPRAVVHAEFGKDYFLMSQEQFDQFYFWMERSREKQNIKSIDKVCVNFIYSMRIIFSILSAMLTFALWINRCPMNRCQTETY